MGQRAGSERTVGAGRKKLEWGWRRNEIELSENRQLKVTRVSRVGREDSW